MEQVRKQHGTSPVRYLKNLGLLDRDTICVHCVWLEQEEIEILARTGAKVATCPQSNMKLGSGIAPLKEMLDAGISAGLGTDGCASNNRLDMFFEMDMCAKIHKVKDLDATVLPAAKVLQMATIDGARVLGLEDDIGSLEPGKKADVALIDCRQPHLQPFYDPGILVYAANGGDVATSIIDGKLVMLDRKILTFDVEEVMLKVRKLVKKLLGP